MTYQEVLERYKKRRHDTVVDTIATSLTYMDNVAVESGLLEETGILSELTETVCGALPFMIIAAAEGTKVILGRKPVKNGVADGAFRMLKTGAALSVGAAVMGSSGLCAAIPVTMGVRALFDRYRSRALTNLRVQARTERLHNLSEQIRAGQLEKELEPVTIEMTGETFPADGTVE